MSGNGLPDIVIPDGNADYVSVLLNQPTPQGRASGHFAQPATLSSASNGAFQVALADFSGNGELDAAVVNGSPTVYLMTGNGQGSFGAETAVATLADLDPQFVAAADLGNGHPDIVVYGNVPNYPNGTGFAVIIGNGDGSFQSPVTYPVGDVCLGCGFGASGLALADLNGDGRPDVIISDDNTSGGSDSGYVDTFLNQGGGSFATSPAWKASVPGPHTPSGATVAVARLAGSGGEPDLVVAENPVYVGLNGSGGERGVDVFTGNGDGTFGSGTYICDPALFIPASNCNVADDAGNLGGIAVADLNGDGFPEIVTADEVAPQPAGVGVYLNAGGSIASPALITTPGFNPVDIAVADLNADGKPDIVLAEGSGGTDIDELINATQYPLQGGPITENEQPFDNGCLACSLAAHMQRTLVGHPVNPEFGDMSETATDLSIPGRGIPLSVTRTYDSVTAATAGPFGYGWTANFLMSLSQPGGSGPVTITQEGGAQVVFDPNGSGYTPSSPRDLATLTHNGDGTWTFIRHAQDSYTFSAAGQLTGATDLNGYTTRLSYTGGQLSSITDPAGRTLQIGWTGGRITSVSDANVSPGRTTTYQYDGAGELSDVIDVDGGDTHYIYNAAHQLTNLYDPVCYAAGTACNGGHGVVTTYNGSGQVTAQQDDLGRTTSFSYAGDPTSAAGGTTLVTDPAGHQTLDSYEYGVLTAQTLGYGTASAATTLYAHDPASAATVMTVDPDGHVTASTVDAGGNLLASTDPLGRTTSATYNGFNEPLTRTDGNQVTTTYTYDAHGNLLSVATPLLGSSQTQTTTYYYDDTSHPGDVTRMLDPDGKTWKYSYDTYGDQASVTDPLGNESAKTYNADGWLLSSVQPKGDVSGCGCASKYTTSYSYADPSSGVIDEFGDVRVITDPLGDQTTYTYDADRNTVSVKDAMGRTTTYTYDWDNELTKTKRQDGTALLTDYNPDGTVLDEKDGKGNAILSFGYDPLARVISQADALNNSTQFSYDGAGNQLTKQDPGGNCSASPATGCTTMTYDAANQLTSISYSDGVTPNVSDITYDADGQRTGWSDGSGQWQQSFDSLHRLTSVSEGSSGTVSYTYNLRNLPLTITYPDTHTVTETYDDAGRWTKVSDWNGNATNFKYDADSNLTKETLPASTTVVDSNVYNAADYLNSITDTAGTNTIFATSYGYNSNNLVTSDTSAPSNQTRYRYDGINRVCYAGSVSTAACTSPPSGAEPFSYDAADNLTLLNTQSQQFNAADELCWTLSGSSSNACASPPSGATLDSYDVRGNRTASVPASGAATCAAYDQADRLTGITTGTGSSCNSPTSLATYAYNMSGLRMSKSVGGSTTAESWDLAGSLPLLLEDKSSSATSDYVYGRGGLPLEQISASGTLWYGHDRLGSTRVVTDSSGTLQASYTFDPYGNLVSSTGSLSNQPFRYAAQYQDSESGFYYLRARYYDPSTGQFLSRDPAVATTRQPYSYAGENPINATDPSGECGLWGNDTCWGDAAGWVNNNIIQPVSNFVNNNQFGWCIEGSAGFLEGVTGSGCVTFNAHSFGFAGTFGHGWEFPGGASLSTGPMFAAGARNPSDLGNNFSYTGASAGDVFPVGGFDSATGTGACGQSVTEYVPSVGVGLNLPWPFTLHEGNSYTWVWSP